MIRPPESTVLAESAPVAAPTSPLDEYYRALLRNLRSAGALDTAPLRSVGITSCARGEGVTTIAIHLALQAARERDGQTLLIDLSPAQDSVTRLLDTPVNSGLAECLRSGDESGSIFKSSTPNLSLLGAGSTREHLAAEPARVAALLDRLRRRYRFVVVDLPVASEMSGCYALAGLLDGIVLVLEAERVRSEVARRVKDKLLQADGKLLGVVLNKRRNHVPEWLYRRL